MIELGALLTVAVLFGVREWMNRSERLSVAQERADERSEWVSERRELLNRIKPDTAQFPVEESPRVEEEPREDEWLGEDGQPLELGRLNGGS